MAQDTVITQLERELLQKHNKIKHLESEIVELTERISALEKELQLLQVPVLGTKTAEYCLASEPLSVEMSNEVKKRGRPKKLV